MTRLPIESSFEMPPLDRSFFDGKPGLDVETKAIMMALFSESRMVKVLDHVGDFPGGEE